MQLLDRSPEKLGNVTHLECLNTTGSCGKTYTLRELRERNGTIFAYVCDICFDGLDVKYDMNAAASSADKIRRRADTFWKARELLPVNNIYIDEQRPFTPLVRADRLSDELGIDLYLKLEFNNYPGNPINPTGTFKDRPVTMAFNNALEAGYESVYAASTGNFAVSTAYFAKKLGMDAHVMIPASLGMAKKEAILQYDPAELIELDGSYDQANMKMNLVLDRANEGNGHKAFVPNASFRPYYKEGSKTNGMEIAFQLDQAGIDPERPAYLVYPVGSGALFCSAHKGVEELRSIGLTKRPVKMWAAQAEQYAPVVSGIRTGTITPVRGGETAAKSIAIGDPGSGYQALSVIRKTKGGGWAVTEGDIIDGVLELYEKEGVFAQDVGGVTLAGIRQGVENGDIKPGDLVVANITGAGHNRFEDDLRKYGYSLGFAERVDMALSSV